MTWGNAHIQGSIVHLIPCWGEGICIYIYIYVCVMLRQTYLCSAEGLYQSYTHGSFQTCGLVHRASNSTVEASKSEHDHPPTSSLGESQQERISSYSALLQLVGMVITDCFQGKVAKARKRDLF